MPAKTMLVRLKACAPGRVPPLAPPPLATPPAPVRPLEHLRRCALWNIYVF